MQKHLQMS
jgi:predicted Zn-dependent protease